MTSKTKTPAKADSKPEARWQGEAGRPCQGRGEGFSLQDLRYGTRSACRGTPPLRARGGRKATELISELPTEYFRSNFPFVGSQIATLPRSPAAASNRPSGLYATELTLTDCEDKVFGDLSSRLA